MRTKPHLIETTGASAGDALLYDDVADEYTPGALPPSGVQSVVAGDGIAVDATDPANPIVSALPVPQLVLLTTEIGGEPFLVWDDDNQLVYTEVP